MMRFLLVFSASAIFCVLLLTTLVSSSLPVTTQKRIASSMVYMTQVLQVINFNPFSGDLPEMNVVPGEATMRPMLDFERSSFDRTNWTSLFAGGLYSMAIDHEGTLFSWGNPLDLSNIGREEPYPVLYETSLRRYSVNSPIAQLSCGDRHVLILKRNGELYSWGSNRNGQLGEGSFNDRKVPVYVDLSHVILNETSTWLTQLAAGVSHSLALTSDGQIFAWGGNSGGELGDGTTEKKLRPVSVDLRALQGSIVTHIGAGERHSVALTNDGRVFSWGKFLGQTRTRPTSVYTSDTLQGKNFIQVSVGNKHNVVLMSDCKVYTWGSNEQGQLGWGSTNKSYLPREVGEKLSGKVVTQIACGAYHTLALTSDGMLFSWGMNSVGQLGDGTFINRDRPVVVNIDHIVSNGSFITQIASGGNHAMLLTSKGKIYSWGQLGDVTNVRQETPTAVGIKDGLDGNMIAHLTARSGLPLQVTDQFVASTKNGTLYSWGSNQIGEIGDGTEIEKWYPVMVEQSGPLNRRFISRYNLGLWFTVAMSDDGVLFAWGTNNFSELGDGSYTSRSQPVSVRMNGALSGKTISHVDAGVGYVVVIANDDMLYSWGVNSVGQLGDTTVTNRVTPVAVDMKGNLEGRKITQIATGDYHVVVLTSDGELFTWGLNIGMVGSHGSRYSSVPVAVEMGRLKGKNVTHITAGNKHTTILTSDGQLFSWGLTDFSGSESVNPPVLLSMNGLLKGRKVSQFAVNDISILALTNDGKLAYWNSQHNYSTWVNTDNVDTKHSITSLFIGTFSIGFLGVTCEQGYYGNDCALFDCFGIQSKNVRSACSGNGVCIDADVCECNEGYTGTNCSYPICYGRSSIERDVCSSHGKCQKPNSCVCHHGYIGDTCLPNLKPLWSLSILGVLLCASLILAAVVAGVLIKKRRREERMKSELRACLLEEMSELELDKNIERGDFYINMKEIKLISRISEGAYGVVFKGEWRNNLVAVKKMKVSDDESFIKEVSILQSLRHPNILYLYGYSSNEDGDKFLITQFAVNGSLDKMLHNGNRALRSFGMKVNILCQFADTMAYLHDRSPRIVHRDLKPQNILLDDKFSVNICDFGVSKATDSSFTMGRSYGTIEYCAPEILTHQAYDEKCDVFSFGIIMHEIFTLSPPYAQYANISIFTLGMDIVKGLRPVIPFDPSNEMSSTNDTQALNDFFSKSNTQSISTTQTPTVVQAFYSLATRCWDSDQTKRPSFSEITMELNAISKECK